MRTLVIIFSLLPCMLAGQGKYTIEGKVTSSIVPKEVFLGYSNDAGDGPVMDSTTVVDGRYSFAGEIKEMKTAYLAFSHDGKNPFLGESIEGCDVTTLLLDGGENVVVTSADSVKYAVFSGSQINIDNQDYKKALAGIDLNRDEEDIDEDMERISRSFIASHPDSYISLSALSSLATGDWSPEDIKPLFDGLSERVRNLPRGKAFAQMIAAKAATGLGVVAPVFTQNDPDGKPVSLTDFRGKYVLIDFWASWCGPCRRENPNVVAAYNQFKDKNFTILGVSLDMPDKRDAWMAAVEKDGLVWTQVSDLKGWKNEAAALYAVRSIPANFLLDPEGRIVAKDLRGEELAAKLAEILK